MSLLRVNSLAGPIIPQAGVLGDAALVVGFSIFTAIFAQLSIPLPGTTVPLTGQTFAVLLAGAVLGSRRGALSQLLYVAEGVAGLPVFAGGTNIQAALLRNTWGYLIGFIVAAFVIGWLAERGWTRSLDRTVAAMSLGHLVIYAVGIIPFLTILGHSVPVAVGMTITPFLPSTVVKIVAAALLLPGAWRIMASLGYPGRGGGSV